jgi:hypothetical protein
MQKPDFIEDFFQSNGQRLRESPSPAVWERLDQRLDQRKARPKFLWSKIFAAASITIVLAASGAVFYALGKKQDAEQVARRESARPDVNDRESLGGLENADAPALYEGNDKIVLAENDAPPPPIPDARLEKDVFHIPFPEDAPPPMETATGGTETVTANDRVFVDAGTVKNVPTVGSPMEADNGTVEEVRRAPAPTSPRPGKALDGLSPALAPFRWMVGNWRDNRYEGISVETWSLKNFGTLEGTGTLMVDGDTLLNERLTILEDNGEVYYIAPLDPVNRRAKFRLKKVTASQFVFEHLDLSVPCTVVLELQPDGSFSTEIRRTGKNGQFSVEQATYLSKRNYLDRQTARRVLSR